uniref:DoxX family protein n=1 Tax=Pyrodinium bahamense TaxID=73915 RepID=A0A7S0B8F2_9DINO
MATPYRPLEEPSGPKASIASDVGALVLRIVVALCTIHHGLQKAQNPEGFATGMVAKWFPFLPSPLFWTYLATTVELVGPALLILGVFTRSAAFVLFATMCFANAFHFELTGFEKFPTGVPPGGAYAFEPSLLCGGCFFYLMCAGPGLFALVPRF